MRMRKVVSWFAGLLGIALACGPPNPVRHDPETVDWSHPPALIPVQVPSRGAKLLGRLLVANGPGPHATVLLLHGFPGNEVNFDLAHAIRRAGWNVLTFHYRGSWGSPGDYRFRHAVEDATAAVEWLRLSEAARSSRVDPGHIAVVGHSMGGFVALAVAARDPELLGAASLAGFDFGTVAERARDPVGSRELAAAFADGLAPLEGVDAPALVAELAEYGDGWSLVRLASRFRGRPVALVAGTRDRVAPPAVHYRPLVEAYAEHGALLTTAVLPADHGFSSTRLALADLVIRWLDGLPLPGERRRIEFEH